MNKLKKLLNNKIFSSVIALVLCAICFLSGLSFSKANTEKEDTNVEIVNVEPSSNPTLSFSATNTSQNSVTINVSKNGQAFSDFTTSWKFTDNTTASVNEYLSCTKDNSSFTITLIKKFVYNCELTVLDNVNQKDSVTITIKCKNVQTEEPTEPEEPDVPSDTLHITLGSYYYYLGSNNIDIYIGTMVENYETPDYTVANSKFYKTVVYTEQGPSVTTDFRCELATFLDLENTGIECYEVNYSSLISPEFKNFIINRYGYFDDSESLYYSETFDLYDMLRCWNFCNGEMNNWFGNYSEDADLDFYNYVMEEMQEFMKLNAPMFALTVQTKLSDNKTYYTNFNVYPHQDMWKEVM